MLPAGRWGLTDIAGHIINRILIPRLLCSLPFYDVANTIYLSLLGGLTKFEVRELAAGAAALPSVGPG